jgi:hypothetical protein
MSWSIKKDIDQKEYLTARMSIIQTYNLTYGLKFTLTEYSKEEVEGAYVHFEYDESKDDFIAYVSPNSNRNNEANFIFNLHQKGELFFFDLKVYDSTPKRVSFQVEPMCKRKLEELKDLILKDDYELPD